MPAPGSGNFLGRLLQYVANELIVDRLANNPSFQRFAVRTAKAVEEAAAKGAEARSEIMEQFRGVANSLKAEMEQAARDMQQGGHGPRRT